MLPATLYGRVLRGSPATVRPDLGSLGPLQGRVSLVDRVIDAASNTFRARLELPNPGGRVPAGLRCSVQFAGLAPEALGLGAAPAAAPAQAQGAGPSALEAAPVRVARFADRYHPPEGPAPVQVARYPDRYAPIAGTAAQAPATLAAKAMSLQPAAQLMAHLPPTASGTAAADGPTLTLALSRELSAHASTSLAVASSR